MTRECVRVCVCVCKYACKFKSICIKTRVVWVPGIRMYVHVHPYVCLYVSYTCSLHQNSSQLLSTLILYLI